ncbi:Involucrin like protein [Argiope bruennichi]|uniref:Involucrin like protein n=1 Tax=Argiope bruennichi TaxID=94029 RepID=A0A8T0FWC9_ARGBR|nr:Involucrin like protein [Argiope bruennichi]
MFITSVHSSSIKKSKSESDSDNSDLMQEFDENDTSGIVAPHKNEKIFYVDIFHRKKETQIKMKFATGCCVLPSSWKVIIDLTVTDILDNIRILITLMRTDSGKIPIEGIVIIWFMNTIGKICPVAYKVNKHLPYKVKPSEYNQFMDISKSVHESIFEDDHFKCLLKEDDNAENSVFLPQDTLILKVQLFVRGCCDCVKNSREKSAHTGEENTRNVPSGGEFPSNITSEFEGSIKMLSGSEGSIKMLSGSEGSIKMLSGSEGSINMPSGGEGSIHMPSGGEGSIHMPSGGEGSIHMPSGGEGSIHMPSGGEGSIHMPSGGEGSIHMPSGGEGSIKMLSGSEGSIKMPSGGDGSSKRSSGGDGSSKMYFYSRSKL